MYNLGWELKKNDAPPGIGFPIGDPQAYREYSSNDKKVSILYVSTRGTYRSFI